MELSSKLCGSLDGKGVEGRMDTCICMAESLCCPPEIITALFISYAPIQASLAAQRLKYLLQCGRPGFDRWVGKISWRRKWQYTPVFLPGESHERRSLVGYSPRGRKELDTTERNIL